jgi:RNA polymerase sigma-70 factor (sigma-E family)
MDSETGEWELGSVETFEAFYRRERPAVVALAYALCGNGAVAEELAQDAFIATMDSWERVRVMENPGAWVRRVVANRSISRFRRLAAEARAFQRSGRRVLADPPLQGESTELWSEVRRLPKRQAQVIALHYLQDLSRREVALILGCSEETVKTHLERARRALAIRMPEANQESP